MYREYRGFRNDLYGILLSPGGKQGPAVNNKQDHKQKKTIKNQNLRSEDGKPKPFDILRKI